MQLLEGDNAQPPGLRERRLPFYLQPPHTLRQPGGRWAVHVPGSGGCTVHVSGSGGYTVPVPGSEG